MAAASTATILPLRASATVEQRPHNILSHFGIGGSPLLSTLFLLLCDRAILQNVQCLLLKLSLSRFRSAQWSNSQARMRAFRQCQCIFRQSFKGSPISMRIKIGPLFAIEFLAENSDELAFIRRWSTALERIWRIAARKCFHLHCTHFKVWLEFRLNCYYYFTVDVLFSNLIIWKVKNAEAALETPAKQ